MSTTTYDERLGRYEITPDEALDFTIDYNDPIEQYLGDDTIQSSSWVVGDGMSILLDTNTDTTATAWVDITTAVVGDTVELKNSITTVGGRDVARTLELVVIPKKP